MQVQSLGWEDPFEKEIATHSSLLAWEIPWTEEPGGLQSMGLQKSRTRLSNRAHAVMRNVFLEISPAGEPLRDCGRPSSELFPGLGGDGCPPVLTPL